MDRLADMQGRTEGFFPSVLGVRFLSETDDKVEGQMLVRDDLCTTPGIMHGGALMAFADTLGGYAAYLALPCGTYTTTIESKTNFFTAARAGTIIRGICECLHRGRCTTVWQTRILDDSDRLICMVTQTQIILEPDTRQGGEVSMHPPTRNSIR